MGIPFLLQVPGLSFINIARFLHHRKGLKPRNAMHLWTLLLSLLVERTTAFCSVTTSSTAAASETTLNYVQSPGYPSGYPPNEDCEWNISPADSSQRVLFYIETVSLEARYDFLSIVDNGGTVWYSESYDQLYGITESGDVKVVFHSDYSIQYGGFSLMYMAVKTSDSDIAPCSSSLTASSTDQNLVYYFSSSSYLYQTGQSQSCSWTITASANQFIEISVPLYTTSNWYLLDLGQSSDYVSGSGPYITSGNTATVTSLDGAFILTYKEVSYSTTDATLTTTPYLDVTDMCDTSQLYADQTSRYLQSNNYPNPSFSYRYCSLTITASNTSHYVQLTYHDLDIGTVAYFTVYDGLSSGFQLLQDAGYSGMTVNSTGSSLFIEYYTNYSPRRGFYIEYTSHPVELPTCALSYTVYNVYAYSNYIQSPNYGFNYDNNVDEYWLLKKPDEGVAIVIEIQEMDLEVHPVCEYDYLDIYDGPCTSYPRLDRLCGSERGISFVDVTGSYVLIHFHTDSTVQYSGFSLLYYMNYEQDFTNYNPDQGASGEEEEGTPVWVYPVIAVGVLFLLILISGCVAVRMLNTRKRRVGSAARLVSPQKKLTTHELLTELRGRYGSKDTSSKMKWKNANHPQPNPAGPGVSIINRGGQSPHPAPGAFGPGAQLDNPAYPPMFLGAGGTSMPGNQPVAPALVQGSQGPSGYVASQMRVSPGTVPSPFQYMTPSEARDKGFYGN